MRLIDADVLAEELWRIRRNLQMMDDTQTADKIMRGLRRAEEKIEEAPKIDAVPVVRCKDCRHSEKSTIPYRDSWCEVNEIYTDSNYFCADGERREG